MVKNSSHDNLVAEELAIGYESSGECGEVHERWAHDTFP